MALQSVLNQTAIKSGRLELNYWIVDGGSTDKTIDLVKGYEGRGVSFISEPDEGMYDALFKGFRQAAGEVCCYINAGDYYHPSAFDIVADIFSTQDVCWLTGIAVVYNDRSQVVDFHLPKRYFRSFIRAGIYGRMQPHIQQESTFWRTELLELVDWSKFRSLRYAGDLFLWYSFAKEYELRVVKAYLGGFKLHAGQLSSAINKYTAEVSAICGPVGISLRVLSLMDKVISRLPSRPILIPLGYDRVIRWDRVKCAWGNRVNTGE
jgi:glycosyltransferase involved in cell wall biosynthesis